MIPCICALLIAFINKFDPWNKLTFFYWHPLTQNLNWFISHLIPWFSFPQISASGHRSSYPYKIHGVYPFISIGPATLSAPSWNALHLLQIAEPWIIWFQTTFSISSLLVPRHIKLCTWRIYFDHMPLKIFPNLQIKWLTSLCKKKKSDLVTLGPYSHKAGTEHGLPILYGAWVL